MSTELTPTNGAAPAVLNWTKEQRELIKNSVAQGATDLELDYFLGYATAKGLDPIAKEVWFIKTKAYTTKTGKHVEARVQIMTGIDGFFRIANSHPAYDGIEHEYGPYLKVSAGDQTIEAPEWVEAIVYRKDRNRPERRKLYWREYAQELVTYTGKLSTWAQKPTVMLEKCADAMALRKAFPQELGDLRVPEEMPREYSADDEERKTAAEVESQQRVNYLAQRTAKIENENDYVIEFGNSARGAKVSESSNTVWLERHLAKYGDQIPDAGKKIIQARIEFLKAEHARKVAEMEESGELDPEREIEA